MRRPYVPPRLLEYRFDQLPEKIKSFARELRAQAVSRHPVAPVYTTVVDPDRNYVRVSDSFCKLLGYTEEELIGHKYDYVSASHTNDIPTVFRLFEQLGYMHGLWVFVHRTGTQILVRYEAWRRPDSYIEANMELVQPLH